MIFTDRQPVFVTLDSRRQRVPGFVVRRIEPASDPDGEYEVACRYGVYFASGRQLKPREVGDV